MGEAPAVTLDGLTKVFGSGIAAVTAVVDVNLTVQRGQMVLIMGPSGSGKTTLLTMIAGLLEPTRGCVRLFGQNLNRLSDAERSRVRRKWVGFVFQSFNLLESLTALQNVEVALNIAGIGGGEAEDRARSLLARVGLGERTSFLPYSLSGGERQRVSIARALANDPLIILADEPTASLDSQNGREIVAILRDLVVNEGRTALIVSHDARIQEAAHQIFWLEDGRIRSNAGQDTLLSRQSVREAGFEPPYRPLRLPSSE